MKQLLALIAVFEAFALSLFLLNIWYIAFLNGQSITLHVDTFGEAWIEYLLWLVITPILVLGLHYTIEEIRTPQ